MANDNRRKRRPDLGYDEPSAESIRDFVVEKVAEKITEKIERSSANAAERAIALEYASDKISKKAAIARLCLGPNIAKAMPEVCDQYLPSAGGISPPYQRNVPVLLIDGATGRERMCNDFNAPRQKCVRWADAERPKARGQKTTLVANIGKPHQPLPKPRPTVLPTEPALPPAASGEVAAVGF